MNASIWKQPPLQFGTASFSTRGGGLGVLLSVRGYYDFGMDDPFEGMLGIGYKSVGFHEGYPFDSSLILTAGIALTR